MKQEHGVHGFAYVVVSAERKREVADASAHFGSGKILFDPFDGGDEVGSIIEMFVDAGGKSQDIGVENDVVGVYPFPGEQGIGSLAHGNLAGIAVGLACFVKCHDHHGGSEAVYLPSMGKKGRFSLFQADGVDDTLSLHAFEPGQDYRPLRGVYHDRYATDVGL